MSPIELTGRSDLHAHAGRELGVSNWLELSQETIDAFAAVTGDHQWIHVDVERASTSELRSTIAHGLLVLALGPRFNEEIFTINGFDRTLHYGYDRVRFPAPAPAGGRLRMRAQLLSVEDVVGGVRTVVRQTFEMERAPKPTCVADAIAQWI